MRASKNYLMPRNITQKKDTEKTALSNIKYAKS